MVRKSFDWEFVHGFFNIIIESGFFKIKNENWENNKKEKNVLEDTLDIQIIFIRFRLKYHINL